MVTSEEVGQAVEKSALEQAFASDPYAAMRSNQADNDTQLNQKLMTPEWKSNELYVMKPKITIKEVYIPETDTNGEKIIHNGNYVVKKKSVKFFDGWKSEKVEIPGGNMFKSDFNTAIINDTSISLINKLSNLYFSIVELSVATGEDYSYDLYKFNMILGTLLNASKSRYGKTLEMVKTNITKGEQTSTIRQMLLQDQKRKGLFSNLRKKLPF